MIILPPTSQRQAHKYALDPPPSLEPENRPAIVHEVELNVPTAADLLPLLLLLGEGVVLVLLDDGAVSVDDASQGFLGALEDGVGVAVVQVVEEDSAQPASLVAVGDHEVAVGPGFEFGVEGGVVVVAYLFVSSVKVGHVLHASSG